MKGWDAHFIIIGDEAMRSRLRNFFFFFFFFPGRRIMSRGETLSFRVLFEGTPPLPVLFRLGKHSERRNDGADNDRHHFSATLKKNNCKA